MKRYSLRFEMDTLFEYLSRKYNIQLTHEDMAELEKIAYMKEDKKGLYQEVR